MPTSRPAAATLAHLLEEQASRRPNSPALFHAGRQYSYGELQAAARSVAKSLLELDVRRGDRVAAWLGNQPEWLSMCLGAAYVGAVFVPLNTWYKRTELEWTLTHCGVSVLVSLGRFLKQDFAAMLSEALGRQRFPMLRTIALLDGALPGALSWREFLAAGQRRSDADVRTALTAVRSDDPLFILYTSGSTAEPKGVVLAHGGVVGNGFDMGERRFVVADDRVWIGSPLFYGLGATNALPVALTHGASIVLQGAFEAGAALEVIESTEATVYYGTGNMTRALLDHPEYAQRRIGSLKKGNAGTMTEYKRMTLLEMGISLASPAYGLTESYGNATVGSADDPVDAKLNTSGHPLPGMELRIVDPVSGAPLSQGEVGLVLLRGYTTPGYFGNPQETARALRSDGFFDTGDLGSLDAVGRFVFHARHKEVIKSGGINVSPLEVEQLIVQHPHVRDAHVVGLPHPVRGELIVAFVDASGKVAEQEIRDFVRERAASFKVPHHVLFYTEAQLPRLPTGKVAKHKLVEAARGELGSGE
ncbi:MAG: class I adenylate-forming enzyme family protein [Lautropia sp.]